MLWDAHLCGFQVESSRFHRRKKRLDLPPPAVEARRSGGGNLRTGDQNQKLVIFLVQTFPHHAHFLISNETRLASEAADLLRERHVLKEAMS